MTIANLNRSTLQLAATPARVGGDGPSVFGALIGSVMGWHLPSALVSKLTMHFVQRCTRDYRASDG